MDTLTSREHQVIKLICQAYSNKTIAFKLNLAESTVKDYMYRIFHKLNMKNRTELAIWADQWVQKDDSN